MISCTLKNKISTDNNNIISLLTFVLIFLFFGGWGVGIISQHQLACKCASTYFILTSFSLLKSGIAPIKLENLEVFKEQCDMLYLSFTRLI